MIEKITSTETKKRFKKFKKREKDMYIFPIVFHFLHAILRDSICRSHLLR